jgi:N-acetylneuraminic acid mutarotase
MALTHPQLARFTVPRVAAVGGLVLVVAAVGAVAWHARSPAQPQPSPGDPWAGYAHQWSRLPLPPQARIGVALAWTGSELVSLGGAVYRVSPAASDGYAFHPRSGRWSHIPAGPGPGRTDGYAVWTGSEVLLVGGSGYGKQQPENVALDPATNTWRRIPKAPIPLPTDAAKVWTGRTLIVWGGGDAGSHASRSGAAYVPATNRWHRIAQAPIALKSPSAAWTGSQVIVFGSSIGASYDPHTNTWQRLPPSTLAPEASSVAWIAGKLVAWDYEGNTQDYSPTRLASASATPKASPRRWSCSRGSAAEQRPSARTTALGRPSPAA